MSPSKPAARPLIACEIFADRILAARAAPDRSFVEVHTARQLAGVSPSLTGGNIADVSAASAVVQDALGAVANGTRDVIAVVPDAAVRIVLLDFDSLPEDPAEAAGVVRFRLKKALPFEIDKSALSFHAYRDSAQVRVVAAVMLTSTLQEYEGVFIQAGYNPGVVLPSTLAALGAVNVSQPTLVLRVGAASVTLAIVDGDELRLFRNLEVPLNGNHARLAEEIHPSLVFYQDTFGARVEKVLVAGLVPAAELKPALESQVGMQVKELVEERRVSGGLGQGAKSGMLAGVVGALLT